MAYSDFTLAELRQRFALTIDETRDLFADAPERDLTPRLADLLAHYAPLGLRLGTEKARSEFVIAPVLAELRLAHPDRVALFSGLDFNVDADAGLRGWCDFILARHPSQLELGAPVCMVVEAKREDIGAGVPQCLAEMVAAQRFNAAAGLSPSPLFGAVTTGAAWLFLRLEGTAAGVDAVEYPIQNPRKIFGILTRIALGE